MVSPELMLSAPKPGVQRPPHGRVHDVRGRAGRLIAGALAARGLPSWSCARRGKPPRKEDEAPNIERIGCL